MLWKNVSWHQEWLYYYWMWNNWLKKWWIERIENDTEIAKRVNKLKNGFYEGVRQR